MTLQRIFIVVTILLFGAIGVGALVKRQKKEVQSEASAQTVAKTNQGQVKTFEGEPIEVDLKKLNSTKNALPSSSLAAAQPASKTNYSKPQATSSNEAKTTAASTSTDLLPDVDRIDLLFQKNSPLPICETIRYKARVPWKFGKPAWLIDYATHYNTPVDFIVRSVNGRADYTSKTINDGQEFSVLRNDKEFYFLLVIDLPRCKMWFYYVDPEEQERYLLKTYRVGLGRLDSERASGSLTPLGEYKLGSRVAVFKPKMMGMHKHKRVELMQVFGTRWIPFESEVEGCTEPAKGYGIHGTPYDEEQGVLVRNDSSIGRYESDGCIRLRTQDIEELFAVISTREAYVNIVNDFTQAKLPFKEK